MLESEIRNQVLVSERARVQAWFFLQQAFRRTPTGNDWEGKGNRQCDI